MPKNKSFEDRKRILNDAFQKRECNLVQLIDQVSQRLDQAISKKTIQNDIAAIRAEAENKGASLQCVKGRYFYDPKGFSLYGIELSIFHRDRIRLAGEILREIPGLDIHEDLNDVMKRLDYKTDTKSSKRNYFIQFDSRPEYSGLKYVSDLLEAVISKTVVSFQYQSFQMEVPTTVILHPYFLKEYNSRWFIFGQTEGLDPKGSFTISTYGLERIKGSIKPMGQLSFKDSPKDPRYYTKDILGVTIPENKSVETIQLKFTKRRYKYIDTNPLHTSQKILSVNEKDVLFEYTLIPNPELVTTILSFGDDVTVIKPKSLCKEITSKIQSMIEQYNECK